MKNTLINEVNLKKIERMTLIIDKALNYDGKNCIDVRERFKENGEKKILLIIVDAFKKVQKNCTYFRGSFKAKGKIPFIIEGALKKMENITLMIEDALKKMGKVYTPS